MTGLEAIAAAIAAPPRITEKNGWGKGRPGQRVDYAAEIARLDALSRERPLSDAESLLLERYLMRVARKRTPYGNTRELARAGIKRPRNEIPTAGSAATNGDF